MPINPTAKFSHSALSQIGDNQNPCLKDAVMSCQPVRQTGYSRLYPTRQRLVRRRTDGVDRWAAPPVADVGGFDTGAEKECDPNTGIAYLVGQIGQT